MDYLYSPYQDMWTNGHTVSESTSKEKEFKTSNKVTHNFILFLYIWIRQKKK